MKMKRHKEMNKEYRSLLFVLILDFYVTLLWFFSIGEILFKKKETTKMLELLEFLRFDRNRYKSFTKTLIPFHGKQFCWFLRRVFWGEVAKVMKISPLIGLWYLWCFLGSPGTSVTLAMMSSSISTWQVSLRSWASYCTFPFWMVSAGSQFMLVPFLWEELLYCLLYFL